jgi:50S ribosome-binding GTPase
MSAAAPLVDRVRSLVRQAAGSASNPDSRERLQALSERLDEPLRVAIAGKVKAGKSTLLNALVGQELAPTDASECTRIVTWYRDGVTYRVTLFPNEGTPDEVPFERNGGALRVSLRGRTSGDVKRLVVDWPSASLKPITLIDTPGMASASVDIAEKARTFLVGEDDEPAASDAVLYLMRHLHSSDVSFLEAFRDQQESQSTPINAIGILSRADEIGVGKLEAMGTAERIASRYRVHPEIRRLCQTVLPVSGLIGQAGTTLTEEHFAALTRIATAPEQEDRELLLSTDRFLGGAGDIDLDEPTRKRLLNDLGLFGIRLSVALIRTKKVSTATGLSAVLVQHSGLPRLQAVLTSQFAARRDVLKARAVLIALGSIIREGGLDDVTGISAELEKIEAGAHEFAEISLLNGLRAGTVDLPEAMREEAERLLGAQGTDLHSRVGVPADIAPDELKKELAATIVRWQARAENPLAPQEMVTALRVLVRTAEGLLAAVPTLGA